MHFPRSSVLILFFGACSSGSGGQEGPMGTGGPMEAQGGTTAPGGRGGGGVAGGVGGNPNVGVGGSGGFGTGGDRNLGGAPGAGGKSGPGGSGMGGSIDGGGLTVPDAASSGRPAGTVPLLVASGSKGRTAMSCDEGLTWKAQDFPGVADPAELIEKGLAFGHGVFMRIVGWGAQCSFMRSTDGVTWQRLVMKDVGLPGMSECGGVTFNGEGFTMVHYTGVTYASDFDGLKWKPVGKFNNSMIRSEHVREVVGNGPSPGIVLAGGANQPAGLEKNPPHVSVDGGKTWKLATGCSTFHALGVGEDGGGALGAGRLVFVGYKGEVCTSTDMATWTEAQVPTEGSLSGKVSFDGTQFWVADGGRVLVSPNGVAWTERKLPTGLRLHAVVRAPGGAWVGLNRTASTFFRSMDGLTWTPATSPAPGGTMYRLIAGYGVPSPGCPAR